MQKTDLNVAPYYDDFDPEDNFHRVLFRPGFAVQARELTTLQSILQNQIERHGRHFFKEGSMVIPGQISYDTQYYAIKLQTTFLHSGNSEQISDYLSSYVDGIITGVTSGITARVVGYEVASTTDSPTLYVKYIASATNTVSATGSVGASTAGVTSQFVDGEIIKLDKALTFTSTVTSNSTTINANENSGVLLINDATDVGSSAAIEEGIFFIRGQFIKVNAQRIILDKYGFSPSYRVGLSITETLVTPESDTTLLDNATGTSNENAKGAHRLGYTLTLSKLALGSTDDGNFVELLRLENGQIQKIVDRTDYNIFQENIARRTFDESGNYTVRQYNVEVKDALDDGGNEGVYSSTQTTDDGNTPSESLLTVQVSPGKAYVRGYEIEQVSPSFIDVEKPRTTENFDSAITNIEVGNFTRVTKVFGSPDLSPFISGDLTEPYKTIDLHGLKNATRGSAPASGQVGVARARAFEHSSGQSSSTVLANASGGGLTSQFNLYLFDIRMFTVLTVSGTPTGGHNATPAGAKITGATSGATGFIHSASGSTINLITTTGNFNATENLISSAQATSNNANQYLETGGSALTLTSQSVKNFDDIKSVFMNQSAAGNKFTADLVLDTSLTLGGTVSMTSGSNVVTGFNTTFQLDLKEGDYVSVQNAAGSSNPLEKRVLTISSDTSLTLCDDDGSSAANASANVSGVLMIRNRNKLRDQQKNLLLRKLRKDTIKTLKTDANNNISQTTQTFRRTFHTTAASGGVISLTAGTNETFVSESNTDYIVHIITAPNGAATNGDILNVTGLTTVTPSGNTLEITDNTVIGASATVKVVATLTRTVAGEKIKTKKPTHLTLVDADSTSGAEYGTASQHKEISIGHADAYRLHAVLDSEDTSANPVLPQFTVTDVSGTFERGEVITGTQSGCNALIINTTDPITFIITNGKEFVASETITGATSGATATLGTFTAGSKDITSRFTLDTGQRDNFYDISRIVRKPGKPVPVGRLLIVCDYFEHGVGDFFSVDSYSSIDYKEIPTYTATRVDPEVRTPSGEFDLRDTVDFRPRVKDATTTTTAIQGIDSEKVTSMSFDFSSRSFAGTGASSILIPKDNSQFQYDFDFFLGRKDMLFLTERGNFALKQGDPAEVPTLPKTLEKAMLIATFNLPPYVLDVKDVTFEKTDNRRYTMRDIGSLERRINQVEYYATLNLLEKDAQSFQVQDENGLDRFKSGFVVDNFSGHGVGDVQNEDYRNSVDYEENELRPQFYMKGIGLIEENTTDTQRTADGYQLTGKLVTLPYTDTVGIQQPYATRVENLNPVLTFTWTGICTLDPTGDEWFEVNRLPALVINVEGDFDQVAAENANILGTVWNSWQTQWTGTSRSRTVRQTGNAIVTRVTTTTTRRQRRTGLNTRVVAQIDRESQGDKLRSTAMIPFMREKNVNFVADGLKPNTRIYPFFDKVSVTAHVTPTSDSGITDHQKDTKGGKMFSDGGGHLEGLFQIPNPNKVGNPKFQTGERLFRLTSSSTNATVPEPETFAQSLFSSTGILRTVQEEIIATRNGRIDVQSVSDTRTLRNSRDTVSVNIIDDGGDDSDPPAAGNDPLAQTFLIQEEGGEFITKIDTFFQRKDPQIPVLCQIREVVNGHPTLKEVPGGRKILYPYLEGTVAITGNQKIVTGTNTKFITGNGNLKVGDTVTINSAGSSISGVSTDTGNYDTSALVTKITAINSDTELEVADAATSTQSGVNISNVNISDTADVPTTFRFDEPVYLKEEEEFCIVLFTPCERYFAWISRMGELDRGGSRMVSKQPHLGILFKSQNNTTWTPSDYEDLKFTIYRASFDTSKTGGLTLVNDVVPTQTLGIDPIRTFNGQSFVQVEHPNHHMYSSTNNVTISGVSSDITTTLASAITSTDAASSGSDASKDFDFTANADFVASNDGSNIYVKIGDEIIRGTIPSSNKIRPLARGVGNTTATTHANGATVELYQLNGIPLDQINKTHAGTLANIGIDTYTVTTTTQATSSSNQGGNSVVATENAQMDGLQTLVPTIVYPDTTLNTNVRTTTGTSPSGSETPFSLAGTSFAKPMTLDENFFFQKPRIIASQINETEELSGQKSFYLNFDLRSTKENLSPVVDLDKKSVVAFTNRLNQITQASDLGVTALQGDYVNSEAASGDSNEAIYITRRVALDTPATGIKLFLDINRFASADVKVMYKLLRSDDSSDFDEIGYNFFNTTGAPDTVVNPSLDVDDFKEYEYTANNLDEFIAFAIKIVMQGTNSSEPPKIKDLRAIALAT